jgi:hypothetical protein
MSYVSTGGGNVRVSEGKDLRYKAIRDRKLMQRKASSASKTHKKNSIYYI